MSNFGKVFRIPSGDSGASQSNDSGVRPSKQALSYIEKTSSLDFIDYMFFRAVKEGGETGASLESLDLNYLVKLNEWLDIQSYMESDVEKQIERKHKQKG